MSPSKEEITGWFEYGGGDPAKDLENATVVFACYETGCYEGEWQVIYISNGEWFETSGSHCSCNGPDWSPVKTTVSELLETSRFTPAIEAVKSYAV